MKAFFDKRIPHPEFNAAGLENEIWKDTAGFTRWQIRTAVPRSRLERKAGAVACLLYTSELPTKRIV